MSSVAFSASALPVTTIGTMSSLSSAPAQMGMGTQPGLILSSKVRRLTGSCRGCSKFTSEAASHQLPPSPQGLARLTRLAGTPPGSEEAYVNQVSRGYLEAHYTQLKPENSVVGV